MSEISGYVDEKRNQSQPVYNQPSSTDTRVNAINQRIQEGTRLGSYGEGSISYGLDELKKLHGEMQSGQLSQKDFLSIADQIYPSILQYGNRLLQSGNQAANAANAAGFGEISKLEGNYNLLKSGQDMLGRDLTKEEIAQATPIFSQPNGKELGSAWLANLAQTEAQNPNSTRNQSKVGEFGGQVDQSFQSLLGRAATAEEKQHFGSLLATGNLDAYGMQNFLQGTSEYQGQQNTKFQQGLGQQLNDLDVNYFNRAKQGVMSQFMQNGTNNSTAMDSALVDLMGQIHDQDRGFLANTSAQQYGNNQNLALNNYGNYMNQYMNSQDQNRQQAQSQMNYLTGRSNEIADYQTQMNDYRKFLDQNRGGGGNGFAGALTGGLQGAYMGGQKGGPWGAVTGGLVGAGGGYLSSSRA